MTADEAGAVALPPAGDGSRRARRSKRTPRRRLGVIVVVLVVVLVAAGLAVFATSVLVDRKGPDRVAAAPSTTTPSVDEASTSLLLQRDSAGAVDGVTLLVVDGSGRGGNLVYVPPGTMVEAPALGLVPISEAAAAGDDDARVAFENLLGARVDGFTTTAPESLAPLGDAPGRNDLDRLVRHQALWERLLSDVRRQPPRRDALGPLAKPILALAAGDVFHQILPVHAVGGADDLYRVDQPALDRLVKRILPDVPTSAERTSVQILNGTGVPGAAAAMVGRLVDAGARVAVTGNADRFDYRVTNVVYYDAAHAADARRLRRSLGVGDVVRSRARLTAVDVTVVVGADFAASPRSTPSMSEGATP